MAGCELGSVLARVRFTCAWKFPLWSIVARAIVVQRAPSKRWSATLPPGKTGRAKPRSVDASGMPRKRTSGATATCAIAAADLRR